MGWLRMPTPAVLLAGNRTGGTMLSTALDGHPKIFCASGEPFHRDSPWAKCVPDKETRVRLLWQQRGFKVSMFKVNWHYLWQANVNPFPPKLLVKRNGLHVVFLERESVLEQAVSNEINVRYRHGRITGHPTHTGERADSPPVRLSKAKVAKRIRDLTKWCDRTREFLRDRLARNRILWLTYEELTDGKEIDYLPDFVNERLCAFFDVREWKFQTPLRKVHRRPYSEIVENWSEIKELSGRQTK